MKIHEILFYVLIGGNLGYFVPRGVAALRSRILSRLWERHERTCTPLNEQWKKRIVRHPLTGRVGACVGVCIQEKGLRDLLFPRWEAGVVFSPEIVKLMESKPESLLEAIETGARIQMQLAQPGGVTRIPLKELALAPAADAAEFDRLKRQTL